MERNTKEAAISRDRFHEQLREWYSSADDGDVIGLHRPYGGTAWVWVKHLGNRYYLNADTDYSGVSEYLALLEAAGESLRWSVVANERGKLNKVTFGPDQLTLAGFYLYRAT